MNKELYYPITEGELRNVLDMKHIPANATSQQIFDANTKILAMLLNRDTTGQIRAQVLEEVYKRLDTLGFHSYPYPDVDIGQSGCARFIRYKELVTLINELKGDVRK